MQKLSLGFALYALCSLIVFFTASFAELAWIAYALVVLPFLVLCVAYCAFLGFKFPARVPMLNRFWMITGLVLQCLVVLTSPADCNGWHQGASCYSFLQMHLSDTANQQQVHWLWLERAFPVLGLLYLFCVALFLRNVTGRELAV
jgi:hypothetical protein